MKVKAIITLYANGKEITPGMVADITDGEAQRLIDRGFAAENKAEKASPSKAPKPPVEKKPESAPALEDILDAIAELDKIQDFSKGGKPTVQDLEALMNAPITAAQLDRAWEIFLVGKGEGSYEE